MKLTVERRDLIAALTRVASIPEKRNTIAILANVLLSAEDGVLTLSATDLDMEAVETCPAVVSDPGATTVPAQTLLDIVRISDPGALISFELGARLSVNVGKARYNLPATQASDFPSLAGSEWTHELSVAAPVLAELFSRTVFAAAKNHGHYIFNGVNLSSKDGEISAVGLDMKRMAAATLPGPACADFSLTIPRKMVEACAKLLAGLEGDVTLRTSQSKVSLSSAASTLTSKVLDGQYVDWRKHLVRDQPNMARTDRDALTTAIKRAVIGSEALVDGIGVRLTLGDNGIAVAGKGQDADALDEIPADYEGAPATLGFQSGYLLDAMANLKGDVVEILFDDKATGAVVFRAPCDPAMVMNIGQRIV